MSELHSGMLITLAVVVLCVASSVSIALISFDAQLALPDVEPSSYSVLSGFGTDTCGCIAPEIRMMMGDQMAQEFARREYWQRRCYNSFDLCEQLTFTEWWEGVK